MSPSVGRLKFVSLVLLVLLVLLIIALLVLFNVGQSPLVSLVLVGFELNQGNAANTTDARAEAIAAAQSAGADATRNHDHGHGHHDQALLARSVELALKNRTMFCLRFWNDFDVKLDHKLIKINEYYARAPDSVPVVEIDGWSSASFLGLDLSTITKPFIMQFGINDNWGYFAEEILGVTVAYTNLTRMLQTELEHMQEDSPSTAAGPAAATGSELPLWRALHNLDHPQMLFGITTSQHAVYHPKLLSTPLGVRPNTQAQLRQSMLELWRDLGSATPAAPSQPLSPSLPTASTRDLLLFTSHPNKNYRRLVYPCIKRAFGDKLHVTMLRVSKGEFFKLIGRARFVLCWPGMGWDTYRLWETLWMGSIPVLVTGLGFEQLLHGLPAIFVDDYADLTPRLLEDAYPALLQRAATYNYDLLTLDWWQEQVAKVRRTRDAGSFLAHFPVPPHYSGGARQLPPAKQLLRCNNNTAVWTQDPMPRCKQPC